MSDTTSGASDCRIGPSSGRDGSLRRSVVPSSSSLDRTTSPSCCGCVLNFYTVVPSYDATVNRRHLLIGIVGTLIAVILVAVASAGEVRYAERPPSIPWSFEFRTQENVPLPTSPPQLAFDDTNAARTEIPDILESLLTLIVYSAMALLVLVGLRQAWRHRPRLTWRTAPSEDFDVLDEIAGSVTADAAEQRAALHRGTPRNAIVECWMRLERAIGRSGFERDPADTTEELTEHVLSQFAIDQSAIRELAALYREARFSTHPMGERERQAAVVALDTVHEGLRRRTLELDQTI